MKTIIAIIFAVLFATVATTANAVSDEAWQDAYDSICPYGDAVLVPKGTDPNTDDYSRNILVDCIGYSRSNPDSWLTYQVDKDAKGMPTLGMMTSYPMAAYDAFTMDGQILADPIRGIHAANGQPTSADEIVNAEAEAKVSSMLISPIVN